MDSNTYRYRAFLSYSQRDKPHAKRLHSALETYRVPKGVNARLEPNRRLGRFFRDDDEMGASTDLGGALRDALENSENLIVVCSPHAARSKWVNAEIVHFKQHRAGGRILAVIVDGIPNSPDPESNCFPAALSPEVVSEDLLSEQYSEPLAVDLRKERFSRIRLRLVAGLLGVSFDSLWQREKRRTIKRRIIATAVAVALASVIGLLGFRYLMERGRVHAQTIERTLATLRSDLASERVKTALEELERLNAAGEQGDVEHVLNTTLSWVSTPAELLQEIKPPALISNGSQLLLLAQNGKRQPLNIHQPYRRIVSSDKRWLLILGADEAVVFDVADGSELARTASNQIDWQGRAFETGSGLLIVVGRFSGISNGTIAEHFLVFSPSQKTLSVFSDYPGAFRFLHPLYVSSDCRSFGIVSEGVAFKDEVSSSPTATDVFFLSSDAKGLHAAPPVQSIEGWSLISTFVEEEDQLGWERYKFGASLSEASGCRAPAADSKPRGEQHGLAGLIRPIGLGAFWEAERRWSIVGEAEPPPDHFGFSENEGRDTGPCTEEKPCPVQDPEFDKSFGGGLLLGDITRPRGVPKDDRSFDSVNGEFVYAFFQHFNAGFSAAWCRKLNSSIVCLESRTSAEFMDDRTEIDIRSMTGRFVFYSQGAFKGFRLYDLLTMRNVTPRGAEFVASTFWADFSPDDKRLFLAMNGRLRIFEPRSDGMPWQEVSDGSVTIPAISGSTKDDKVAGLLALDDTSLIVVRSSGVVSRFDWRTGQQSWGYTIGNAGEIVRVVPSRNRRFLLLIGRAGGRLLDTKDGLVLSGVLAPPPAMDGGVEMFECLNRAFVGDTGMIEVSCGEKKYRREPNTFHGDVRSRLREILSNESLPGSK